MKGRRHLIVLGVLATLVVAVAVLLWSVAPTLNGAALRDAELHTSLAQLRAEERAPFFRWLLWDCLFALLYTVFYTWMLRWLAAGARVSWLGVLGRTLSWFTAIALVFDLCENAILWAGAVIGATRVSPWLPVLVELKFASTAIFVGYVLMWGAHWLLPAKRDAITRTVP